MTDTYLVLTTPTTTDVFPVRDIDRMWRDDASLRVALRPSPHASGNATAMLACHIITDNPTEALRIATDALSDALRTGQSVRADVGCEKPEPVVAAMGSGPQETKRDSGKPKISMSCDELRTIIEVAMLAGQKAQADANARQGRCGR